MYKKYLEYCLIQRNTQEVFVTMMIMMTTQKTTMLGTRQFPVLFLLSDNHQGFSFYSKAATATTVLPVLCGFFLLLVRTPAQKSLPCHCAIPNTQSSLVMDSSHGRQASWLFLFWVSFNRC